MSHKTDHYNNADPDSEVWAKRFDMLGALNQAINRRK